MSNADVVVPRYQPSTTVMGVAGAVGVLGLVYTAFAVSQDATRGMLSYTLGWAYWFTIAFGSLIQILTFRASAARWVIGIRRMIEEYALWWETLSVKPPMRAYERENAALGALGLATI